MILLTLLSFCLTFNVSSYAGGEIGTGFMKPYANRVSNYRAQYPKSWKMAEFGPAVSFIENKIGEVDPSAVSIDVREHEAVRSISDLKKYLEVTQPLSLWVPVELADRRGFQSLANGQGSIYLLRSPGVVMSIRVEGRTDEKSQQETEMVVQSLGLD